MNGPIGKQMVDTLVESSANFEVSLSELQFHAVPHCNSKGQVDTLHYITSVIIKMVVHCSCNMDS